MIREKEEAIHASHILLMKSGMPIPLFALYFVWKYEYFRTQNIILFRIVDKNQHTIFFQLKTILNKLLYLSYEANVPNREKVFNSDSDYLSVITTLFYLSSM